MRVPLEWLKDYVKVNLAPETLAKRLTLAGLEVVGIHIVDGQVVFDLEITPNRADCLSILGVAREVAVITGQALKRPAVAQAHAETLKKSKSARQALGITLQIEDRDGCQRYIGRLIENIRIKPSPEWLTRRLVACGIRAINNVVDITNYVLLEYGQPLHAFDADRLSEAKIVVRRSHSGETLTTLDGEKRSLTSDMLVIADSRHAVAVAGVMGGVGSEVSASTKRILLESALFDPVTVRRTARKLGLASESSYRFERGVDPSLVEAASRRAAALIEELAEGKQSKRVDVGRQPSPRKPITLDVRQMNRWLGTQLQPPAVRSALAQLGCRVASRGQSHALVVTPPLARADLKEPVDLYEELARVVGFDRLPTTVPVGPLIIDASGGTKRFDNREALRAFCAGLGLTEAISWSLVSETTLTRCGYEPSRAFRLANPLSQDHAFVRPSLLMGLLPVARRNLTQAATGVRFFEWGPIFRKGENAEAAEPKEVLALGIMLSGIWAQDWNGPVPNDFFRMKGIIQALGAQAGQPELSFAQMGLPWAQTGCSAQIQFDGRTLGVAGQLARKVTQAWDIEQDMWFAELFIDELLAIRKQTLSVQTPASFPPVKRDLSILISKDVPYETVAQLIQKGIGSGGSRFELIDRFAEGKQIPAGQYSLTFSIEYRDESQTLTAVQADSLHQRITQALTEKVGATLR